jgi:hypothetical protein
VQNKYMLPKFSFKNMASYAARFASNPRQLLFNDKRVPLKNICNTRISSRKDGARLVSAIGCGNENKQITICVEGNISVGKTTFLQEILNFSEREIQDKIQLIPEPVMRWQSVNRIIGEGAAFNILDEFYRNPAKLAYTFQHFVFMTRFIEAERSRRLNFPLKIMERSVFSDRKVFTESLFENGWLTELELSLYHAWFTPMIQVC